ncbi:hypothetical protein PSACC_00744 [Paramicrosporidium saccamoebae]|uniref:Uncharacterized protein n=1 Tax=Paramicrosporidium saccamoebae TaxID=1246581 RepID=A0A2H9TP15_9FUNG|nr:hypothetical protein PSACC_00744 [Paramicrosporidium saccamoebae]
MHVGKVANRLKTVAITLLNLGPQSVLSAPNYETLPSNVGHHQRNPPHVSHNFKPISIQARPVQHGNQANLELLLQPYREAVGLWMLARGKGIRKDRDSSEEHGRSRPVACHSYVVGKRLSRSSG